MSGTVEQHYEGLLSQHYSWMFGLPVELKATEQLTLFKALGVGPGLSGLAIDLGCGPGYQSFALADLGAAPVLAIDTSRTLLNELDSHAGGRPVKTMRADIRDLSSLCKPSSVETLVCMGDTLTHLADRTEVQRLFADALSALKVGGTLVLTYRDLSQPVEGLDRFLPVRADDDRIMTCVLDFHPETVTVTDIVYCRDNGEWRMEKSSYEKLRLDPTWIEDQLRDARFRIDRSERVGGLQAIVARKPS
jgi:SAM-dependent methyltransferase